MHNDKVNALQDKLRQVGILGEFADLFLLSALCLFVFGAYLFL